MSTSQLERRRGSEFAATSWSPASELNYDEWVAAGRRLGILGRASHWWIGDWLNYGEKAYGQKYEEAIEVTGYPVGYLMDMAWVAATFETSKRFETLSWSHHRAVAALPEEERARWLDRAAREGWSQKRLLNALKRPADTGGSAVADDVVAPADRAGPAAEAVATVLPSSTVTLRLRHEGEPGHVKDHLDALCNEARDLGFELLSVAAK